jgi:flagellar biosynthesis protein FlhB
VQEELRRYEGDPKIKERRRAIHRQIAYQRMLQRVPKATVVITNPTEFAVAVQYEAPMKAPKVVAKGKDFIALRIRELAAENDVPIVQRPELARALYKSCEVDQEIPLELYKAVAEVLAYVYLLKKIGARTAA